MDEDEGLRDLLRSLRRRGVFVVAVAAAAAAAGLGVGRAAPPRYTSEALVPLPASPPPAAADPGAAPPIPLPSAAELLKAARRVAASGFAEAVPAGVATEAAVDETRSVLVLRASAGSPGKAREGAERLARAGRAAMTDSVAAALRLNVGLLLAAARSDLAQTMSAVAAGGARAAHLEMHASLLRERIGSLEKLARDPEPLLALVRQGREQREGAAVVLPAVARPRRAARDAASGGALGLFASLAIVFLREASAPQRTP